MLKKKREQSQKIGWEAVPIPARCIGCPYPRVGIVCRGPDGTCTRTDMEQMEWRSHQRRKDGA